MAEPQSSEISFVFFTFNDDYRLEYALRNVLGFGEVVVFDDGSTDNTKAVAEKFGVKFLTRPKTPGSYLETPEVFEFVKQNTKYNWIYWGYVDNMLPAALIKKLVELSKQDHYKYIFVPVNTYLWGDVTHPIIKAAYPCFFRKDFMDFSEHRIHSLGHFTGPKTEVLELKNTKELTLRHFSLYDLNKFVTAHLRYANAEATTKMSEGRKFSLTYMFGSMGNYFWLFYRRGFKAKVIGLYSAMLYAFFRLMVSVRMYELEHDLDLKTIEAAFAKEKQKMLDEINTPKV